LTTDADTDEVTRCWQAYLRWFDLEHTIRLFKQTLGWTTPKIRSPQAADRWTWVVIAAHTQLRLARGLAVDLRRPWEKPLTPERMTPARVRRGFRFLRPKAAQPASAPKPSHPGPGRPPGVTPRPPPRRRQDGHPASRQHQRAAGQELNNKLRAAGLLVPTLPGRHDRVRGGSPPFRKSSEQPLRSVTAVRESRRTRLIATTTATTPASC
jgi:hypothetical protein